MEEGLTRYELGTIKQAHDRAHYTCITADELARQLRRIDLPYDASRFDVAERIRQIEKDMEKRGI